MFTIGDNTHLISIYDDAYIEPLLMDTEKNTLKAINSLPKAPDDFFPEGRADTKPQDRVDNE